MDADTPEKPELTEEDIDRMPVAMVRTLLRRAFAKKGKPRSEQGKGAEDSAEKEREDLADLHAEHKGKGPDIPVTDDDLPEALKGQDDDEDSEDEEVPAKKRGK
jgi:hypothetical protein